MDDSKKKRVARDEVGTRNYEEPNPGDPDTRVYMKKELPLQVYCDYEAIADAEGNQTPIFLCAETDEEDETVSFHGPDCTSNFFDWLEESAVAQDGDDRKVIVIFHNLEDYDGMFILQHCYATHREVTDQITVGTKILSLKSIDFQGLAVLPPISSRQLSHHLRENVTNPLTINVIKCAHKRNKLNNHKCNNVINWL